MKENLQIPSRTRLDFLRQIKSLRILATLAMLVGLVTALGLSSPVQTSSALAKDVAGIPTVLAQDQLTPPEPSCTPLPQEGEPNCTERNGATTCETNFRELFEMDVVNPCTDELVHIVGETHVVTHTTITGTYPNLKTHMRMHLEMQGKGTTATDGPSASARGIRYMFASTRASQVTDYTFSLSKNSGFNSGPPPENISDPGHFLVISHGASPNFEVHFELHMNVSANDQTTGCFVQTKTECSGQAPSPSPSPTIGS